MAATQRGPLSGTRNFATYEDGSYNFDYYYDDAGDLRFVLGNAHAGNGNQTDIESISMVLPTAVGTGNLLKGPGCPGYSRCAVGW